MTLWSWPGATLVRVIDGDTFVALLTRDLGFNGSVTFQQRLRLNRIDAAPLNTPHGKTAQMAAVALLNRGVKFTVDTVAPYKYGDEWMAEVTLADGTNVSDRMVEQGFAVPWDGHGSRPAS